MEEDLKRLEQQFGEAKNKKEKTEANKKTLEDRIKQNENQMKNFTETIKMNVFEKTKKDSTLVFETNKLNNLEEKLKGLNEDILKTIENLNQVRKDLETCTKNKKECEMKINDLKKDTKNNKAYDLKEQYEKEQQTEKLQIVKEKISDEKNKKSSSESELKTLKDKCIELERNKDKIKFEIETVQKKLHEKSNQLNSTKLKLTNLHIKINHLDQKISS